MMLLLNTSTPGPPELMDGRRAEPVLPDLGVRLLRTTGWTLLLALILVGLSACQQQSLVSTAIEFVT